MKSKENFKIILDALLEYRGRLEGREESLWTGEAIDVLLCTVQRRQTQNNEEG